MEERKKKRIHMFVPAYIHELLKIESAHQHRSMTQVLTSALLQYLMQCDRMPKEASEKKESVF